MDSCYQVLEIKESADLNEVKKAYLNKVRVFTPEENPKEFIKIRKAYEEIINKNKCENKIKESFFKITELIILENNKEEICKYTKLIKSEVNLQNFKFVSDKLIDTIIYCNKNSRSEVALHLIDEFVEVFADLNLINLKERYLLLRFNIEKRG